MKPMIYVPEFLGNNYEILDEGNINGFDYKIINYGPHPCAYVSLPSNHKYYNEDYDNIDINCHGGLTFGRITTFKPDKDIKFWIGWDYAHLGDYSGLDIRYPSDFRVGGKKWTTEEILEEVKNVICQL